LGRLPVVMTVPVLSGNVTVFSASLCGLCSERQTLEVTLPEASVLDGTSQSNVSGNSPARRELIEIHDGILAARFPTWLQLRD